MLITSLKEGIIIKSTGSWYKVWLPESKEEVEARVGGKMRTANIKATNPVAVGDHVILETTENDEYRIIDIKERKNYIIRKATKLSKQTHIIAANIDCALFMVTLVEPKLKFGFLDRLLVSAEAYDIPARIVFNKIDLISETELEYLNDLKQAFEAIGYPVHLVSVKDNKGIKELQTVIDKKVTLISGTSGVGKSSFLNAISPKLDLRVSDVSDFNEKGKHTTTFAEMHKIGEETFVIDTPGLRAFGFTAIEANDLKDYFPEMVKLSGDCKFYNCHHLNEPKCAVREAFENGELPWFRYENYNFFYQELKEQEQR